MAGQALGRRVLPRALVALTVVAFAVPGQTAGHAQTRSATLATNVAAQPRVSSEPPTVTLITGDRVRLRKLAGGRTTAVVDPALRPNGVVPQFHVSTRAGDTYVVPTDVGPLLSEVLDPGLFNVTDLVEQGYADPDSTTLPLILTYPDSGPRTYRSRTVPAGHDRRVLDSVAGVAAEVDKADVAKLGAAVFKLAAAAQETGRRTSRLTTAQAGPLAGVDKIWLDGRVEAQLDRSTGQISAPAAWAAGYTGSGVKVAVLDTGVDDSHPDLAGRVSAARNFTEDPDARDLNGHGTHVASIIGGTGAASGGGKRGVAYDADLVSGKVLDADGVGALSWILDGMEWAAGEADADIVNMSLGADPTAFGSRLVTQAVETLSSEHGTLFVVAAGNNGRDRSINSPGDAPSALTVGAVDRQDQLADFSSRGPAPVSFALKPDLTAPGVGISAARAADGKLGGSGPYLELSGTSMATPHVAGAAALLRQARPDLSGAELKGALMSTAVPTPGLREYEQGAGRVDVGRVLDSPVLAVQGSLDFGIVPLSQDGSDPVAKSVTYRNGSDEPVTLDLHAQLDGPDGTPADLVSVAPAQLTIQPGATGTAQVTLEATAASAGSFTGQLVAELASGSALHTPIGFVGQPETFDLRVRGIARDGRATAPWVGVNAGSPVVDVRTGETMTEHCATWDPKQEFCMRVPAGTYSVLAFIRTRPAGVAPDARFPIAPLNTALVGDPEVEVTGDTTLTLDARQAVEVVVDTPAHKDARANLGGAADLTWRRIAANGTATTDFILNNPGAQAEERLFMQPMGPVSVGSFGAGSRWRLEAPSIALSVPGDRHLTLDPLYYRMDWYSDFSRQFPVLRGTATMRVVDAGEGRAEDLAGLDLRGALALIRRTDELAVAAQSNAAADAGARMVVIYNDRPDSNAVPGGPADSRLQVPTVRLSGAEGSRLLDRLHRGRLTVRAEGKPASPYVYDLVYVERDRILAHLHHKAVPKDLVRLDRDFHSLASDEVSYTEGSFTFQPTDVLAMTTLRPVWDAPRSRVDYHVSDPKASWSYVMSTPERPYGNQDPHAETSRLDLESPLTTYAPRERRPQSWLGAPVVPGLNQRRPVVRLQDRLVLGAPLPLMFQSVGMVDGQHHFSLATTTPDDGGFATLFRVWRGDEVLWETEHVPGGISGAVSLPTADEETYRMAFEVANRAPWAQLSTRTRTGWTFRSAHTDAAEPLPLLTLAYDLGTDLRNVLSSRGHGSDQVAVQVGHQAGVDIRVTGLTFAVSYDDGGEWHGLRTSRRGDGRYVVDLDRHAPRDARFLSFRVSAQDADGNRIGQEIIRAVALPHRR